ncbi:endonuclease [Aquibium microcysteis]|uniref:endonuclease n=1 Tax=Aquibium microcysteis TaxID=675281 RepID=UPI00165D1E6F|nr:endonuclease [Aquibium microcysteis]
MPGPSRICRCQKIIAAGERCPCQIRDARERKARHDARRPSARQRGYTAEWQHAARAFLAEPQNSHCACGAPATVVMHVISIRKRPDLRMMRSNWRAGCQRCNALDAAKERQQ